VILGEQVLVQQENYGVCLAVERKKH